MMPRRHMSLQSGCCCLTPPAEQFQLDGVKNIPLEDHWKIMDPYLPISPISTHSCCRPCTTYLPPDSLKGITETLTARTLIQSFQFAYDKWVIAKQRGTSGPNEPGLRKNFFAGPTLLKAQCGLFQKVTEGWLEQSYSMQEAMTIKRSVISSLPLQGVCNSVAYPHIYKINRHLPMLYLRQK